MINKKRCVLVYGFNDAEIKKLKIYLTGVKEIEYSCLDVKINDLINGITEGNYNEEKIEEKVILFNSYGDNEIRSSVRKLRETFPGVILAVVTPASINWSFKYLLSHLLEERKLEQDNK